MHSSTTKPELNRGIKINSVRAPLGNLPLSSSQAASPAVPSESQKTPPPGSGKKQRFPSPPPVMVDKKGNALFTRGNLLGEVFHFSLCNFQGGFARCYEASDSHGDKWAVKVIPKLSLKSTKQKQKLIAEIKIHQMLYHDNIVRFKHVFEDDNNVYMILELCENGVLYF